MSIGERLRGRLTGKVVIVGVGNPLRGDDAAGCHLADSLQPTPDCQVINAEDVPENMLGRIVAERPEAVLFLDAADLGSEPGAVALVEPEDIARYCPTTHRPPLRLLMEILRRETGADVVLLGIQPGKTTVGSLMSREVASSVARLGTIIAEALGTVAYSPPAHRETQVGDVVP